MALTSGAHIGDAHPHRSRVLLFAIVLLLSFGLAESAARLIVAQRFEPEMLHANAAIQQSDPTLGWILTPNLRQRILTRDGDIVTYSTDTHGWRVQDPSRAVRLDAETLFVGDSFTFGAGAQATFPDEYARVTGTETINAGVAGYGTDQAVLAMRRAFGLGATPSTVVYAYYGNDLQNNLADRSIHLEADVGVLHKPRLNLHTGHYELADVAANDMTRQLARHTLAEDLQAVVSHSTLLRGLGRTIRFRFLAPSRPAPAADNAELASLEGNLEQFALSLRERGIRFVLLQIDGAGESDDRVGKWLAAWAGTHGAIYLRPTLERHHYLRADPHLSDAGARHVASELARALSPPR